MVARAEERQRVAGQSGMYLNHMQKVKSGVASAGSPTLDGMIGAIMNVRVATSETANFMFKDSQIGSREHNVIDQRVLSYPRPGTKGPSAS